MTAGIILIGHITRTPSRELAKDLLDPSLSVRQIADEYVSMLIDMAEESGTLCYFGAFLNQVSLAFTIVLGLARESGKEELAEKAVDIMKIGLKVVEELRKNKYSCEAIERGLKDIENVLQNVDELLGLVAR